MTRTSVDIGAGRCNVASATEALGSTEDALAVACCCWGGGAPGDADTPGIGEAATLAPDGAGLATPGPVKDDGQQ